MLAVVLVTLTIVPLFQWLALQATLAQLPKDVRVRVEEATTPRELLGRWVRPRYRVGPGGSDDAPQRSLEEQNARLLVLLSDVRATQRRGMVLGVGFSVLLCLAVAARSARGIAAPIEAVTGAASRLAAGDLTVRVALPSRPKPPAEAARLAGHFDAMAAALQRGEAERRATVADVAHELRNPLATLQLRLEAMRDGLVPTTPGEVLNLLRQSSLLARLVDDLRLLALADAGRLTLRRTRTDMGELVLEAVGAHGTAAQQRDVRLVVETPPDPPLAYVDPDRVRQILYNLLDNALRHTPRGGRVEVSLRAEAESLRLAVRDTGPGFGDEAIGHAFQRVARRRHRGELQSAAPGAGLGLSIVRALVESHGGDVSARDLRPGAEILVRLPWTDMEEADAHVIDTIPQRNAHVVARS